MRIDYHITETFKSSEKDRKKSYRSALVRIIRVVRGETRKGGVKG